MVFAWETKKTTKQNKTTRNWLTKWYLFQKTLLNLQKCASDDDDDDDDDDELFLWYGWPMKDV